MLDNGDELDADVCVVGAGVVPTTKFVSGLETFRDGRFEKHKLLNFLNFMIFMFVWFE